MRGARALGIVIALGVPLLAQVTSIVGGSGGANIGNVRFHAHGDPPSSQLVSRFGSAFTGNSRFGVNFISRRLTDNTNHVYLGYELVLQEQQLGTYLATFGKLGTSPLEMATMASRSTPPSAWVSIPAPPPQPLAQWTMLPLPAIPAPRVVHDGDVISIELMVDAATGDKLIDDIEIYQVPPISPVQRMALGAQRMPAAPMIRAVPTEAGAARDFEAADAEMRIMQPRVTLNGVDQAGTPRLNASGALLWLYMPGRGRYVLSLTPRPDLGFKQAGEVRGGAITFTMAKDTIKLECFNEIAPGHAPYHVYAAIDPSWEPTAEGQKGRFAMGSVDAGELVKLGHP